MSILTASQVVTLSLAVVWGEFPELVFQYVDREDIAANTELVSPGQFAWRKYPNRIDLEAVCTALRRAKKPVSGKLVIGDNRTGWLLSGQGVRWVMLTAHQGRPDLVEKLVVARQAISDYLVAERARLASTNVVLRPASSKAELQLADFYEFALVNEYFERRARARRYCIVDSAVACDAALAVVWERLKARFPGELVA